VGNREEKDPIQLLGDFETIPKGFYKTTITENMKGDS
jgi:hypothetical protein